MIINNYSLWSGNHLISQKCIVRRDRQYQADFFVILKMITIDTTQMCSHLQRRLFDADGEYHQIWLALQDDPELTAVVRSRQLHIYRNGKKKLVLAGKAAPKILHEDPICDMLVGDKQVETTELFRTSQSWDGAELPDYPHGRPELVAVKYVIPQGRKLGWHQQKNVKKM